jgi:hypothetical protein
VCCQTCCDNQSSSFSRYFTFLSGNISAIPDYAEVIKEPVDLSTIEKRIRHDNHYKSKQMLLSDLILMVNNCKLYNDEESAYVQCATSLEAFIGTLFADCAAAAAAGKI